MRVQGATTATFKQWLPDVGEGRLNHGDPVTIPRHLLIDGDTVDHLLDDVFPDINRNFANGDWLANRVV
jgi:hypothetical protein